MNDSLECRMTKGELDGSMAIANYSYLGEVKPYLIYASGYDRIAVEKIVTPGGIFYDVTASYKCKVYHKDNTQEPRVKPKNDLTTRFNYVWRYKP